MDDESYTLLLATTPLKAARSLGFFVTGHHKARCPDAAKILAPRHGLRGLALLKSMHEVLEAARAHGNSRNNGQKYQCAPQSDADGRLSSLSDAECRFKR